MVFTHAHGQLESAGVIFSLGAGAGYSTHADSYVVVKPYAIREFSGLRAIVFEAKAGWKFNANTAIYAHAAITPANSPSHLIDPDILAWEYYSQYLLRRHYSYWEELEK